MESVKELHVWCDRYNLTINQIMPVKRLIMKRIEQETKAINGDPHSSTYFGPNQNDKNANAKAWKQEVDFTDKKLLKLVKKLGFDGIDFGVGLYPALIKGDDRCIMVP